MNASLVVIFVFLTPLIFIPQAYGQLSFGDPVNQILHIKISDNNNALVTHELISGGNNVYVELIDAEFSNLIVMNQNGEEIQYGESFFGDKLGISIFNAKKGDMIEYVLEDIVSDIDEKGELKINYEVKDAIFSFPDKVDRIFVNNIIVDISKNHKINCHGCSMNLVFFMDESIKTIDVEWEGEYYPVKIKTISNISNFEFNQSSKLIKFDIDKSDVPVTIEISKELLWNPYDVYLNNKEIIDREIDLNDTHVLLYFFPDDTGEIMIVGISAIPEFPIFAPLVIGIMMMMIIQLKSNRNYLLRWK